MSSRISKTETASLSGLEATPPGGEPGGGAQQSYGQILKSSALIGGSSVIGIGLSIVRGKAMAVLLGPAGVGLMGLYFSIAELARYIAGMGINNSGVRQIAEAVSAGDQRRIARTVTTLRRVAVGLGALGALLLVVCSRPVSQLSFGDAGHAGGVALLGMAVFFGAVSAGQGALVQGMRRIGDMAKLNVLGSLYGTIFSIGIVYYFYQQGEPERGVVPSLVCVAGMAAVTSWWYSRKVRVERVRLSLREVAGEASGLLKLGLVFMTSVVLTMATAYLVRVLVIRVIGESAAGFYQAAWALGGIYVGFILQAMGADFYPRLTGVAKDRAACNRLVNEQIEVSLLLAGPGVLGTIAFAPVIIHVFYSAEFGPAVELLRWLCLGMLLRVACWPMGYLLLAKGARGLFFWTELASNVVHLALVWFGLRKWGLMGTGVAFFGLYAFYWVMMSLIIRRLTGFEWSVTYRRTGLLLAAATVLVFCGCQWLPPWSGLGLGVLVTMAMGIYSLRTICRLVPMERLPRPMRKLLGWLKLAPTG